MCQLGTREIPREFCGNYTVAHNKFIINERINIRVSALSGENGTPSPLTDQHSNDNGDTGYPMMIVMLRAFSYMCADWYASL